MGTYRHSDVDVASAFEQDVEVNSNERTSH